MRSLKPPGVKDSKIPINSKTHNFHVVTIHCYHEDICSSTVAVSCPVYLFVFVLIIQKHFSDLAKRRGNVGYAVNKNYGAESGSFELYKMLQFECFQLELLFTCTKYNF